MCVCVCVVLFVTTYFLAPFNSCAVMYACVHLRLLLVVDCFHTALFSALLIYGFVLLFCCVYCCRLDGSTWTINLKLHNV